MTKPRPDPAALPDPAADPSALRAFVATAKLGTVVRAADALGRTQPSVSARIAALEAAWGTRLFRRQARGMTLTPEGARLLPMAEAALRGLEDLDRAAGLPVASGREARIGSGDALGREVLPRVLARLVRDDPELSVRVVEGAAPRLLEALRAGEIDVALVVVASMPGRREGIELEPICESPVDVLLPSGSAPRGAGAVPVEALRGRRLVSLQPGSGFRLHLERAFADRGVEFAAAVEVGNLSLVRRFVAAGLGVAPVPAIAFDPRAPGPRVDRRPLVGVPPVRYHAARRFGVTLPDAARRLLERIRAVKPLAPTEAPSERSGRRPG